LLPWNLLPRNLLRKKSPKKSSKKKLKLLKNSLKDLQKDLWGHASIALFINHLESVLLINLPDTVLVAELPAHFPTDRVLPTNQDKLEPLAEQPLKQAATMAAADTVLNQRLQLAAYQKDINQDLLALLPTNQALADIDQELLVGLLEVRAIVLTQQEDLQVPADQVVRADLDGDHYLPWIRVQVQNRLLANMLLQNPVKMKQHENSKTSKISKRIKNQKSTALLTPVTNKASAMKTMKAGAHAKAAAINAWHLQAKS
jgi:hypothetical protein